MEAPHGLTTMRTTKISKADGTQSWPRGEEVQVGHCRRMRDKPAQAAQLQSSRQPLVTLGPGEPTLRACAGWQGGQKDRMFTGAFLMEMLPWTPRWHSSEGGLSQVVGHNMGCCPSDCRMCIHGPQKIKSVETSKEQN